MSQLNSSIFSSEVIDWRRLAAAVSTLAWIIAGLSAIDIGINAVFSYPRDPKITDPSRLQMYFEYGRSVEGQLARMTKPDPAQTAPITLAGWYEPLKIEELPAKQQDKIITIYGFSHAVRLGHALRRVSDRFTPRIVGAPGSTANWAYGAYLRDRGGGKSAAIVLAFMSMNLPFITTVSPMTWNIGSPFPYTGDRFYLGGGELRVAHPPFSSFDQYVTTFYNPARWKETLQFLADNDTMYDPLIMHTSPLDRSALYRLALRAYGQRVQRNAQRAVLDQNGFHPESEQIRVAQAIIREFARQVRSDGMTPVIYLVNNLGYSDYLFRALEPVLTADNIPYLSSHTIVSPSDPRGYLPDSHFTDAVDNKLAEALVRIVSQTK